MTRRGARVFAVHEDARRATRVAGVLALSASTLGALLTLAVSRWSAADAAPLVVLLALVALAGVVAVRAPGRMPPLAVVGSLVLGTAFVAGGMVIVGSASVDDADNEMFFLLPVLYSAYFCRGWVTALVTVTASAGYGAALLVVPSLMPGARWVTTTAALTAVAALVTVTRARDMERLATAAEEASRDPLTGLLNRRGLEARAAVRVSDREPVSLLLIDIDHFTRVNDVHGHVAGDDVLAHVADVLRRSSRTGDLVARIGGEEFAVVLPACEAVEAAGRAHTLRRLVEQQSRRWATPVTLSVGAATTTPLGALGRDLPGLMAAADTALYAAKDAGRNTVRSAEAGMLPSSPQPRSPTRERAAAAVPRAQGPLPEDVPGA